MELRKRLGAAVRAFLNPALRQPRLLAPPEPRNVVVLDKLLAGRRVLVTGAARNVGRGIALEMAAHGADVYATDVDADACARLEAELRPLCRSRVFCSDVSSPADNEALCAALDADGVTIDVLVNNVGVQGQDLPTTFRTNVFGPLQLADLVARRLVAAKAPGSITFVTSIHQEVVRGERAYGPSKAALAMLVRELALELAPQRIRVNGIAPGAIAEDARGEPERLEFAPLEGTTIPPRYIGRAAVHLASDYFSRYTTGAIVKVDGGLSLFNHIAAFEAGLRL